MQFNKKDLYEIEIKKLAYGGQGVGKIKTDDGDFTVFVRGTIPGDKVNVRLKKIRKNYAEAETSEILKPSDLRIEAKCKHFDICGGCTWQNLTYEKQLEFKELIVRETIEHLGGLDGSIVRPMIKCKDEFYYRNKMEFSFGDNKNEDFVLGFHPTGMKFDVFNVEECFLQDAETITIVKKIYEFFKVRGIPRFIFNKNKGILRSVFVRKSIHEDKFLVNLVINDKPTGWESEFVKTLQSIKKVASIYVTKIKTLKGRKTERKTEKLWGDDFLRETLKLNDDIELHFQIDPDSFFQTNTRQAEVLYNEVLKGVDEACLENNCETAFDLYCGTGTISLVLAKKFSKVFGFEISSAATKDADENAAINSINNVEFVTGDVLKTVPTIKAKPDLIIVDPPRSGVAPKAIEHILELAAKTIIYVSCNPATLARDLKIFSEGGYTTRYVQPVDMFPQTYHVECVAVLVSG